MTENKFSSDDVRRRRILFRATHRGSHETDLLIGCFVRARLVDFTVAELDEIEEIMELSDTFMADWLTGRLPIPDHVNSRLLRAMKDAAGS